MEIQDNEVHSSLWCGWIRALLERFKANIVEFARETKNLGQEDPRRIIHSLKVGLAITLISLFYYFEPLYDGFGVSAMWAVMTVVLVFEFSVGMVFCFFFQDHVYFHHGYHSQRSLLCS